MSARPPTRQPLLRRVWRLLAHIIGVAVLLLLTLPMVRAAARHLELPPEPKAPMVDVVSSPQLELAAFVSTLLRATPPTLDTPPKVDAYSNFGQLAQSSAAQLARALLAEGVAPEGLYRLLLMHTEPPALTLRARLAIELVPAAEMRILRDRRPDLKRFTDAARRLYSSARLAQILERHQRTLEGTVAAYAQAYEGDEPYATLQALVGERAPAGGLVLVPSLFAVEPLRFSMPTDDPVRPLHISILPIGDEGVPGPELAARRRYLEAAYWAMVPVVKRFSLELAELGGPRHAIDQQLARGLFLARQGARDPEGATQLRDESVRAGLGLVPALELAFQRWDQQLEDYPTLMRFMPELLEYTQLFSEGKTELPRMKDPSFEWWEGDKLVYWKTEVVEPALGVAARPSTVSRVRSESRADWALRLSGERQTNEWLGVFSEGLPVQPGDKITITARMSANDVRAKDKAVTAAHLEARVLNRDGAVLRRVVGREFVGTVGWENVKLEFIAPGGADKLRIGVILAMMGDLFADEITLTVERPPMRRFIQNGDFEVVGRNGPRGWDNVVASRLSLSGPPVSSRWELDPQGAAEGQMSLKLTGDALTSQWIEVRSTPVAVTAGQRVIISGMQRARGVLLEARQHRHANLTMTFLNASGAEVLSVEAPVLEASSGWTPVEFEAVAPLEAVAVRVGCLLTMSGEVWFDDIHLARR